MNCTHVWIKSSVSGRRLGSARLLGMMFPGEAKHEAQHYKRPSRLCCQCDVLRSFARLQDNCPANLRARLLDLVAYHSTITTHVQQQKLIQDLPTAPQATFEELQLVVLPNDLEPASDSDTDVQAEIILPASANSL